MRERDFPSGGAVFDRQLEDRRRRLERRLGLGAVAAVALLLAVGTWGAWSRHEDALATTARVNEAPHVRTMEVKPVAEPRRLSLPGTMQPFNVATIFARATGYIERWTTDFGAHVKAGETMAVIAAPDLDQQLAQAQAQVVQTEAALGQAQAQATLQQATNQRTQVLVAEGWQTRQQGDTDSLTLKADLAAVKVAEANLAAQKANLSRLQQLKDFEQVTAPFDGTVTNRQIDVGSLVSADSNSGTPLFTVERSDVLRVQVYVPQDAVFTLHDGAEAEVTVPEMPGRTFKGKVSRTASALAADSRTLLVQVDVENRDGMLRSGLYCLVNFVLPRATPAITVPSQAVIFNKQGLSVAVVVDGKVQLRPIALAQDDGATVEVKQGLDAGDQVILSPPTNVTDGMAVTVVAG